MIRNLSMRMKFFLILSFALILLAVGVFLTSRLPYRAYDEQLYQRSVQLLSMLSQQIDAELAQFADQSLLMLGDTVLQARLTQMTRLQKGSAEWVEASREVRERCYYFSYMNKDYKALQFLLFDGTEVSRLIGDAYVPKERMAECLEIARARGGREAWVAGVAPEGSLLLVRDVRQISELKLNSLAMIMLTVDINAIADRNSNSMAQMGVPLTLAMYLDGKRVYASGGVNLPSLPAEDGYQRMRIDGEQQLVVRTSIDGGRWVYLTCVPYDAISQSIRRATGAAVMLAAVMLFFVLAVSLFLIASILRHFAQLNQKFRAFADGHYEFLSADDPYRRRRDEIGALHCQFDAMARENKRMIEDNWEKQQLLMEAQIRQLREQIRPHFLFNTLASIAYLAQDCQDPRIAKMTTSLSRMLRASLNDKRELITLKEDLQIAREYMNIQLIRYGEKLAVDWQVEERFMEFPIPAMTIQPLMENAVRYAAEEMLGQCRITASACVEEGRCEIRIEDNGPGMDEDILQKLADGRVQPGGLGIGLQNIDRRLKMMLSTDCGLRISRIDGITRVAVLLPAEKGDFDDSAALG